MPLWGEGTGHNSSVDSEKGRAPDISSLTSCMRSRSIPAVGRVSFSNLQPRDFDEKYGDNDQGAGIEVSSDVGREKKECTSTRRRVTIAADLPSFEDINGERDLEDAGLEMKIITTKLPVRKKTLLKSPLKGSQADSDSSETGRGSREVGLSTGEGISESPNIYAHSESLGSRSGSSSNLCKKSLYITSGGTFRRVSYEDWVDLHLSRSSAPLAAAAALVGGMDRACSITSGGSNGSGKKKKKKKNRKSASSSSSSKKESLNNMEKIDIEFDPTQEIVRVGLVEARDPSKWYFIAGLNAFIAGLMLIAAASTVNWYQTHFEISYLGTSGNHNVEYIESKFTLGLFEARKIERKFNDTGGIDSPTSSINELSAIDTNCNAKGMMEPYHLHGLECGLFIASRILVCMSGLASFVATWLSFYAAFNSTSTHRLDRKKYCGIVASGLLFCASIMTTMGLGFVYGIISPKYFGSDPTDMRTGYSFVFAFCSVLLTLIGFGFDVCALKAAMKFQKNSNLIEGLYSIIMENKLRRMEETVNV
eukprot:Nk52_evm81s2367 gene=Nk52_evmTU81s2367